MNHPVVQFVLLWLAVFMGLLLVQRFLGFWAVLLIVLVCGVLALGIYMLRYHRPIMAQAYRQPMVAPVIDLVCHVTSNQPPVEADNGSPLDHNIMLRIPQDFEWAARRLKTRVIGHGQTIDATLSDLRNRISLRDQSPAESRRTPLGIYLLMGSDGIGKEHLARSLAEVIYRQGTMTSVNLQSKGDPQGDLAAWFGNATQNGMLAQAIRKQPHQVLFLENVHQADELVRKQLLEILRSGGMVDPRSGGTMSFEHVVFIFTISATLPGVDNFPPDQRDSDAWRDFLHEGLATTFGLDPAFPSALHAICSLQYPDQLDRARVIACLIRAQCQRYALEVDFVEPEIIALEVSHVERVHGFQLTEARLARKLEGPILKARQNHLDRLILTQEVWK